MLISPLFYMLCISTVTAICFLLFIIKSTLSDSKKTTIFFSLSIALGFYWFIFGDLVPTIVAHKQYCEKEAGFKIYVTPEQWAQENSDLSETLAPHKESISHDNMWSINNRFATDFKLHLMSDSIVRKKVSSFIDTNTKKVLAEDIDFSRGYGYYHPRSANALKLWLNSPSCYSIERLKQNKIERVEFFNKFKTKLANFQAE